MTLARKLTLHFTLLTTFLALAAMAVVWGVVGLHRLASTSQEEFQELRFIRQAHLDLDQATVHIGRLELQEASMRIDSSMQQLAGFAAFQSNRLSALDVDHNELEHELVDSALVRLRRAQVGLAPPERGQDVGSSGLRLQAVLEDLGLAMGHLETLASELDEVIGQVQARTVNRLRVMLWTLGAAVALILAGAVVLNRRYHRSIVGPLRYIQESARRLAGGDLGVRLHRPADQEFTDLQADFNTMAEQLQDLCADLERRVQQKSRELLVSERRASLGYLAAGVAHEINNPLGIISGHAESLLRRLRAAPGALTQPEEVLRGLEIIKDEAFRTKRITQGLLDLSQMGDDHRAAVSLRSVAEDTVALVRSAPAYRSRTIEVLGQPDDALAVLGSGPELTQVVLNLTINALQSTAEAGGRVQIEGRREDGWVELVVRDNGSGMASDTLEKAFEPFFTTRRSGEGCGLGLSISHAIIQRHGGTITASSAGLGLGSVFTMRLPAARGPGHG